MDQDLTCLHPNPGWQEPKKIKNRCAVNQNTTDMGGNHCLLELYGCDPAKLNDEAFLRTSITTAAKSSGATLLNLITHHFEPQGVTGLALLAESHISIHTWPEHGYAAIDVFTCGDHTMPEQACRFLCNELSAEEYSFQTIQRQSPLNIRKSLRKPNSIS